MASFISGISEIIFSRTQEENNIAAVSALIPSCSRKVASTRSQNLRCCAARQVATRGVRSIIEASLLTLHKAARLSSPPIKRPQKKVEDVVLKLRRVVPHGNGIRRGEILKEALIGYAASITITRGSPINVTPVYKEARRGHRQGLRRYNKL